MGSADTVASDEFEVHRYHSEDGCLSHIYSANKLHGDSTEVVSSIVTRVHADLDLCTKPCGVLGTRWEAAKTTIRTGIGARISDYWSRMKTWHTRSEEGRRKLLIKWHVATCSDDNRLSVYFYCHPAGDDTCQPLGEFKSVHFAREGGGAHTLDGRYASVCELTEDGEE